jgi:hypothetical protein
VRNGLVVFFIALFGLALAQFGLGFMNVSPGMLMPATLLITAVFIAVPVFAIYKAASHPWTSKLAIVFVLIGIVIHFTLYLAWKQGLVGSGSFALAVTSLSQVGFFLWCMGLGVLVATLLKDKNLIIPVSLFLAAYDVFLVLTPMGITKKIMQAAPEVLPAIGYKIPSIGNVAPYAIIGPADFLFMGMFFVSIYRFKMKSRETLLWLIPAILVYLLLSMFVKALPLLVPIGLTVLIVNWKEFNMNKEERNSTIGLFVVLALVLGGLFAWSKSRPPAAPSEPSQTEPVQAAPEPGGSLGQGVEDRGPSPGQNAPGSTPNPP